MTKSTEEYFESKRATGRTYRQVLRTILAASSKPDQRVVYVCHNDVAAHHTFNMLADLTFRHAEVNGIARTVTFPNGSVIRMVTVANEDRHRGIRYTEVLKDHMVSEEGLPTPYLDATVGRGGSQ